MGYDIRFNNYRRHGKGYAMAEFWEQQLMDRLLNLCFVFRDKKDVVMPAEQVKDVVDYVKFLLKEKKKETVEDIEKAK